MLPDWVTVQWEFLKAETIRLSDVTMENLVLIHTISAI
jgi:hypothetical protein